MIYSLILAVIAAGALLFAWNVPRARLWIGSIAASYAVSTAFWYAGKTHGAQNIENLHALVTLSCDWIVCIVVFLCAKEKWEIWLYRLFLFSIVISLLRLSGFVQDGVIYASALELITASALVLIWHIGRTEALRNGASHHSRARNIRPVHLSARAPRKAPPWHIIP